MKGVRGGEEIRSQSSSSNIAGLEPEEFFEISGSGSGRELGSFSESQSDFSFENEEDTQVVYSLQGTVLNESAPPSTPGKIEMGLNSVSTPPIPLERFSSFDSYSGGIGSRGINDGSPAKKTPSVALSAPVDSSIFINALGGSGGGASHFRSFTTTSNATLPLDPIYEHRELGRGMNRGASGARQNADAPGDGEGDQGESRSGSDTESDVGSFDDDDG